MDFALPRACRLEDMAIELVVSQILRNEKLRLDHPNALVRMPMQHPLVYGKDRWDLRQQEVPQPEAFRRYSATFISYLTYGGPDVSFRSLSRGRESRR